MKGRSRTIGTLINLWSADPVRRAALMDARCWLADTFYGAEGDTARLIRLRKGLLLEHVAAKVGVSRDTLARLENGAGSLGKRSTARLAAVLGADPRVLKPAKRRQRAASRRSGR